MFGKNFSDETKEKMSKARKKYWLEKKRATIESHKETLVEIG